MRRAPVRQLLGAALRVLLAVALITAVVRSGARYFFCPLMDTIADAPCCEARPGDGDDRARVDGDDCCEVRRLTRIPDGSIAAAGSPVDDAPLVAVLAAPKDDAIERAMHTAIAGWRAGPPRPPPREAREARARLMVFLI